jgi:hypothetical protein
MGLRIKPKLFNRPSWSAFFLFFLLLAGIQSCRNDGSDVSSGCYGCKSEKPTSELLTIKVTRNSENPYVLLTIYRGKYDTARDTAGYIEIIDTAKSNTYKHLVPVDQYYSVKARYKSGNKIIYAVDGSIFQAQKQSGCDNQCWQMVGGYLDVTLKFH